jgi:gamma-glutamyltranspeptidase / glutathione hydrolase
MRKAILVHYTHIPAYPSRRSPVFARNIVATSHPLATQAGLSMIARGGNAVDSAIAAAATLTVVEPTGNGLGSDAFCILWDGGELYGLNASGRSPARWTRERFAGRTEMPLRGWESVTVPGAVSAWRDLSARFGRLPFAVLLEPAIAYADQGFHVTPAIARQWQADAAELAGQPGFADTFMPDGRAPEAGQLFRNPDQARSLRLIAESEGRAFYEGELAEQIAAAAKANGSVLIEDDLAAHRNDWCGVIGREFATDRTLHEIPPNGQGIAACMAIGMLDALGIAEYSSDSVEAIHLQIEVMKLALADAAAYVADPGFMSEVTADDLLSPGYLRERAALIDRKQARDFGPGVPRAGGTVCLATADEDGMMVSFIQSNYKGFGSGAVVPGTGISLQNRGWGFSLEPGHPNEVGPAKRPFHTIIPGFLTRAGAPAMAFGLMGGPMQAQGHVQMALRTQVWGQDPQTAVDAPRWRVVGGRTVALEDTMAGETRSALAGLGHRIDPAASGDVFGFGGAQIVCRIDGGYVSGSDPRKDGQSAGF